VRNLRILGSPKIPDSVRLSAEDHLAGWRADYFQEKIDDVESTTGWRKDKEEIVSPRIEKAENSFRESLLQYHRPLAEDGELTFEFYYLPRKTEVHAALDREVLLVRKDGVKLHWLTDGAYERTGLSPANESPIAGASPTPPLKPDAWNQVRLALRGDTVTLDLNGDKVVEYRLTPGNDRTFGLFHFEDRSEVRVRNVVYRGQWPTRLPALDEQELARK
jgi:hypothetical protein